MSQASCLALLLVLAVPLGCSSPGAAKKLADNLEADFRRQVLPAPTKQNVIAFLNEKKIEFHESASPTRIAASIHDVEKRFPVSYGVFLTFEFDDRNALKSYEIKALGTGP